MGTPPGTTFGTRGESTGSCPILDRRDAGCPEIRDLRLWVMDDPKKRGPHPSIRMRPQPPPGPSYSRCGAIMDANALRARFSLDFTVPRLQAVMSAISSYDLPSNSRSTNTWR